MNQQPPCPSPPRLPSSYYDACDSPFYASPASLSSEGYPFPRIPLCANSSQSAWSSSSSSPASSSISTPSSFVLASPTNAIVHIREATMSALQGLSAYSHPSTPSHSPSLDIRATTPFEVVNSRKKHAGSTPGAPPPLAFISLDARPSPIMISNGVRPSPQTPGDDREEEEHWRTWKELMGKESKINVSPPPTAAMRKANKRLPPLAQGLEMSSSSVEARRESGPRDGR